MYEGVERSLVERSTCLGIKYHVPIDCGWKTKSGLPKISKMVQRFFKRLVDGQQEWTDTQAFQRDRRHHVPAHRWTLQLEQNKTWKYAPWPHVLHIIPEAVDIWIMEEMIRMRFFRGKSYFQKQLELHVRLFKGSDSTDGGSLQLFVNYMKGLSGITFQ